MEFDPPLPADITLHTALRLNVAAEIAFPDGSMTGSGLVNEHRRRRLEIEVMDGKRYVTLAEIGKMRTRCRVPATVQHRRTFHCAAPANDDPDLRDQAA